MTTPHFRLPEYDTCLLPWLQLSDLTKIVESYLVNGQFILSKIMIAVNTDDLITLKKYLIPSKIDHKSSEESVINYKLINTILNISNYRYTNFCCDKSDNTLITKCYEVLCWISTIANDNGMYPPELKSIVTPSQIRVRWNACSLKQKRDFLLNILEQDNGKGELGIVYLALKDDLKDDELGKVILDDVIARLSEEIMDLDYPYLNILYDLLPILKCNVEQFGWFEPISPQVALYYTYNNLMLEADSGLFHA